jgi:hypothetical protein
VLARNFAQTLGIAEHFRRREQVLEFLVALGELFEFAANAGLHGKPGMGNWGVGTWSRHSGESALQQPNDWSSWNPVASLIPAAALEERR